MASSQFIFQLQAIHHEIPWKIIKNIYQNTILLHQFEPRFKQYDFLI